MRSAVAVAAFAAGAAAVPHAYKRDVVTDVDIVYATEVVTVYASAEPTTTAVASPSAEESSSVSVAAHYGHGHGTFSHTSAQESTAETSSTYVAPTSTSTYVAPTSTSTSSSVYVAPTSTSTSTTSTSTSVYVAPSSSSTSTWVYVAPTTSSISVYVAPSTSSSAASSLPTTYNEVVIAHHNLHRANHSASEIVWNDTLANSAQDIANSCIYAHNVDADGGGYGQNIAAGVESNNVSAIITDLFYNGEVNWFNGLYGQAQPDMTNFESWGHFSQIVWKDTVSVGCATTYCPGGLGNVGSDVSPYFTVCNYYPPGNYANEYGDNIGSSNKEATADWNYYGTESDA